MASRGERLTLRAYGRTIGIDADPTVIPEIRRRLPASYRLSTQPPEQTWTVTDLDHDLGPVELWVAEHATDVVVIHAGCVVVGGRAVLLPGRSMTGKSSLTAALVAAGATYYSDEYAVLDSRGAVRPYARPLSLRPFDGGAARRVDIAELGAAAGRGTAAVGLIMTLRYDAVADWSVQEMPQSDGVMRLIDNAVAARRRPRAVLTAADRTTAAAASYVGTRGEAAEAAARIMALAMTI